MSRLLSKPSLLFLTAASVVAVAWVVPHAVRISAQQRASAWISAAGGYIAYERPTDTTALDRWLVRTFGKNVVRRMVHVTVGSPGGVVTPEQIRGLRHIPSLDDISFSTLNLSPEHLDALADLKQLVALDLRESSIDDDDLATVATMDHLVHLGLSEVRCTDAGLAHIASMTNLHSLDLSDNDTLTGDALRFVAELTDLDYLRLAGTPFRDADLVHLAPLTNLRTLELGEHITDAGMPHVAALPALRELSLENATVTDDGVDIIMAAHPDLEHLHLFYTYVTGDKMAELERAYPKLLLQAAY